MGSNQILKAPQGQIFAIRTWGDPAALPVIALHGWLDNAASFDVLAPLLTDVYLVAIDLPGHGLSSHRSHDGAYYIWSYLDDVRWVAGQLGLTRFSLLGHSMGGAIACLLSALFPDRVRQLLLLDAIGPLATRASDAPSQMRKALRQQQGVQARKPNIYASELDAVTARSRKGISRDAARMLASRGLSKTSGGYYWHMDQRLRNANLLSLTEEQVACFMRQIQCPSLLVSAAASWQQERQSLFRLRQSYIDGLETVELDGNHHQHMEAQAPAVAVLLNAFLHRF
ncbi:MAG: alpha/beta hydrolase [Pseudomonadales bacterium]|nr:alpha/beta hydrolase [Pseudomonadales bacterium]